MKQKFRRMVAISMIAFLIFGVLGGRAAPVFAASFSDINNHWAEGHIISAVEKGYVSGYSDGTFLPDGSITRAEFVKMINTAKEFTDTVEISFSDANSSDWYYAEIQKGVSSGYISGYANGSFQPNAQITREEAAVIFYRISPGSTTDSTSSLRDASSISSWAKDGVNSSYNNGYITGYTDGSYSPQKSLTRAEAVKIINTMLGIKESEVASSTTTSLSVTALTIANASSTKSTATVTAGISGTVYWVVVDSSDETPTAKQIYNGKNANNKSPEANGSLSVTANVSKTFTLSGLEEDEKYALCAVVYDSSGNLSSVKTRTFTQGEDEEEDDSWFRTFTVSAVDEESVTLKVKSTTKGTLYWVAVAKGTTSTIPSKSQIKKGYDKSGDDADASGSTSLSAGTQKTITVDGLDEGVSYRIYAYIAGSSEDSSIKYSSSFSTDGSSSSSTWLNTFSASSTGTTTATISVKTSKTGTFYWVAVENGSTSVPTASRVASGKGKTSDTVANSGKTSVTSGTSKTITVTGLSSGTSYRIYGVVDHSSSGYGSVGYTGSFTTNSSATNITSTTPSVSASVSGTTISASVSNLVSGTVYYRLLDASSSSPSASTVAGGISAGSGTSKSISIGNVAPGDYVLYVIFASGSSYSYVGSSGTLTVEDRSGSGDDDEDPETNEGNDEID